TLILENKNIAKYNFKKLRKINFYGSKMDVNIIQRLCDTFTDSEIIYSYGLTEASPRVSYIKKNDLLNKKGSSGKPIKDVSIFIENKNKKELGPGMVGEIVVTGPNVMMGYYKNLDLTRKALNKSKLYTGDIGFIDQDGFLFIKGRKDNMLNVAGKNVYAEEIEEILCSIEGVKESLVTGKKDKFYGDKLIAYIVKNEKIDTEEILSYLKLYLDNYKVPHEIICVKSLEKTVSGKIVRKEVKNYE
ncbi:class I adenylate-forming enzyme family protein, partial [Clostridium sp.]